MIKERYELLKRFAYDARTPVQILVASHSPELLRVMHTHHSMLLRELRVVRFDEAAGTTVAPPSGYRDVANLLDRYLAGDL